MMRSLPLAALAVCCLAGPAFAVDSGLEVQVYPVSATGRDVLLYPGGQFMRMVPTLRQPGDTGAPIHLHMPVKRPRVASAAPRPASPPVDSDLLLSKPAPKPAPKPKVAKAAPPVDSDLLLNKPAAKQPKLASAAPRPAPKVEAPASPYGGGGAASLLGNLPTISATPQASAPTPPAATGTEGMAKQGVILFAHDADSPAESSLDSIRLLAGQLNNGMSRAQSRVELMAYGGNKGDKGSDARRLSLKRALAIRQVLIDSGVSSARIDVHAQGGVDDTGPTDRVDVFIRA